MIRIGNLYNRRLLTDDQVKDYYSRIRESASYGLNGNEIAEKLQISRSQVDKIIAVGRQLTGIEYVPARHGRIVGYSSNGQKASSHRTFNS